MLLTYKSWPDMPCMNQIFSSEQYWRRCRARLREADELHVLINKNLISNGINGNKACRAHSSVSDFRCELYTSRLQLTLKLA
jgi:hypothetical protein